MKKVVSSIAVIAVPFLASAQDRNGIGYDPAVFNTCAVIFTVGLFMLFILAIIKRFMDFRLKTKIVEKGIPENIASSILQTNPKEDRNINIKWFAILAGLGGGLTFVNNTQPLGIHSLAIMAFSISISFLGYYLFIRWSDKQ